MSTVSRPLSLHFFRKILQSRAGFLRPGEPDDADASDAAADTGDVQTGDTGVSIQEGESGEEYYTVQRGDTLDKISLKLYGTTDEAEAICKMNGLTDGNLIFIGQKLLLP